MRKPVKGGDSRDPFRHLRDERAQAEAGDAWFLGDDDGPELHIETNRSSNLTAAHLDSLEDLRAPLPSDDAGADDDTDDDSGDD
jgi:hypothetical protein